MIGERVMPEGEQDVVAPPDVVRGGDVQCDRDERTDVLYAGGLDVDVGDDDDLVVIVRRSSATGEGPGDAGKGGSIRAAAARASSARAAAAHCSSSRSVEAVKTRAWAASYFFFVLAVATTMASSFYHNSAASAAW
jgi:hypothetical protein